MSFVQALKAQRRSLHAALHSEIHELLQLGGVHLIFAIAAPVFLIGVALCWHTLMQSQAPYGTNRALFLVTGFLPVHLFVEVSSEFRVAANQGRGMRRYPAETLIDKILVATLLNALIYLTASVLGLYLLSVIYGADVVPSDMSWMILTFFEMVCLGFGVGLCNAQIELFVPVWRTIYGGIGRALILFSGIFYIPSFLPPPVRNLMEWNPVMQGVETFRYGFYPGYPKNVYHPLYFWSFTIATILVGMVCERVLRSASQGRI